MEEKGKIKFISHMVGVPMYNRCVGARENRQNVNSAEAVGIEHDNLSEGRKNARAHELLK